MRKRILIIVAFVLGIILFGGTTTVVAYNFGANQVGYTPTDSAWKVNSVSEAIDDLYIKKTGNNYSTDEKVVGTWLNGKPIYAKSFVVLTRIKIDSSSGKSVDGVTTNYMTDIAPTLDEIISINITRNRSEDWVPDYPFSFKPESGKFTQYDNPGSSYLSYWLYADAVVTFQYTKTTDVVSNGNNQG